LTADLIGNNSDIAVITETHLKVKHTDGVVGIPGYNIFRRDRARRRGGGVALYVRSTLQPTAWRYSSDDSQFELLWVRINSGTVVGAIYHPPRPIYSVMSLLDYIEASINELQCDFPTDQIVLAGDFNQLPDSTLIERTGFLQLVRQPTRGANILDRIYVSGPMYSKISVVRSTVRSDHKAVIAYAEKCDTKSAKSRSIKTFRSVSPASNALFLQLLASID